MPWWAREVGADPWVIGHRGAAGLAPENTLHAFRTGWNAGADGLECDVQLSRDGVPMVFHDEDLLRLCGREGCVADFTTEELGAMSVLESGEVIPTLAQVAQLVAESGCSFFVEIKDSHAVVPSLEVLAGVLPPDQRVVVGSFHAAVVRVVVASGRWPAMQLVAPAEADWSVERWRKLRASGVTVLGLPWRQTSPKIIQEAHDSGLAVWCWTVNEAAFQHELANAGVDALVTDYPDVALKVLGR
jgi:glycerophosphoryl diester phosphodiesterase